ncbi:hypothetical protein EVC30_159 [Rhizobium phage RHph_Y1_11]|nr:hypothetical protein EVC30_159 [Rhizobium phage RHph_Y1_11]
MAYETKIYLAQKYDRAGNPGAIVGVKLTFAAAHAIAKANAPAKVLLGLADKTLLENPPVLFGDQRL